MLNAIGVIARARFLIFRNSVWRGKIGRKIAWVALAIAVGLAAFGIYTLMNAAVSWITSSEFEELLATAARTSPQAGIPTDIRAYLVALPSAALFSALILLVLTSFSTVLSSLYLSGDIDMLLTAPVPMRAVFVVKFFGGLILPYILLFVLLFPALIGFGQGLHYGPAYYLTLTLVLLVLPLLPLSIGALLVMAVVRVIPARRAREIVSVIGGLVGISWYLFSQFARQIGARFSGAESLGLLDRLNNPLLPSAWAGRALIAAGEGAWGTWLLFGGMFALLAIGLFVLALILGERVYYLGWSNMAVQGGHVRRRTERRTPATGQRRSVLAALGAFLPAESAAIVYKDLRVFPRDLRNVQQLIFPLLIAGIWVFNLISGGSRSFADSGTTAATINLLFPAGISAFVCLSLSTAIGGPTISREGKGFWQLKTAPISAWRILLGKLVLAYAPYPIVGSGFMLLISLLQHSKPLDALTAWALVLVSGLGVSAITLGLGAAFPRLNWEKPSDQNTLQAGCLAPVFYLTYLALVVGFAVGLPLLGTLFPGWGAALTVLGWLLVLGLTALVTWGFLAFGAARLDRLEVV